MNSNRIFFYSICDESYMVSESGWVARKADAESRIKEMLSAAKTLKINLIHRITEYALTEIPTSSEIK